MSTLSLRLPDSLHEQVKELAKRDGISINQFVASAIAEKMSALLTEEYIKEKMSKGNKNSFLKAMSKVPDSDPEDFDRL
jgi:predicted transcriptional regulator